LKISFVTALSDFALEDTVIEVLTNREFELHARAHSVGQLNQFLSNLEDEQRILVVIDEQITVRHLEIGNYKREQICLVQIASDIRFLSDEFMDLVFESLRQSEESISRGINEATRVLKAQSDFIGFTGSNSAPGITTLTINIAAELANSETTTIVDADPDRNDIAVRLGVKGYKSVISLHERLRLLDLSRMDNSLAELISLTKPDQKDRTALHCIDLGQAPDLSIAQRDRRLSGRKFIDYLQFCRQIVFVAQPEHHSLSEMESFARGISDFYPEAQITYVLNQSSSSTRHLAFKKSFRLKLQELGAAEKHFVIPRDYGLIDKASSRFATISEVGPRSSMRKALTELSIYLGNSR